MSDYIEVKFKGQRKAYFANPLQFPFKLGDYAIVEAEKGEDIGKVNHITAQKPNTEDEKHPIRKITRKALPADIVKRRQNELNEAKAVGECKEKVKKHKLNMKLVSTLPSGKPCVI